MSKAIRADFDEVTRALREAVDLPLFLYNFPGNTGVELDIADDHIRGMLTDGTIAGVK